MRIWLSKHTEVPIREQLTEQVMFGIISQELQPGQRLPSIRELARRLRIHSNTVNAAYHELARRGWVEFRKGSGVYVRALAAESRETGSQAELDQHIASFLRMLHRRGFSQAAIQSRLHYLLELQPPDHFLILESDPHLQQILKQELTDATQFPVLATPLETVKSTPQVLIGAIPVALYSRAELVRPLLPPQTECTWLHLRSIPKSLTAYQKPGEEALLSVVSHWPEFLKWGRMLLIAAGIAPDAVHCVTPTDPDWVRSLRHSYLVITDVVTAQLLPAGTPIAIYRVIGDESFAELQHMVASLISGE